MRWTASEECSRSRAISVAPVGPPVVVNPCVRARTLRPMERKEERMRPTACPQTSSRPAEDHAPLPMRQPLFAVFLPDLGSVGALCRTSGDPAVQPPLDGRPPLD